MLRARLFTNLRLISFKKLFRDRTSSILRWNFLAIFLQPRVYATTTGLTDWRNFFSEKLFLSIYKIWRLYEKSENLVDDEANV